MLGAPCFARASSLSAPSNMPATDAFTRGPLLPAAARFVTNSTPVAARATAAFDKAWHKLLGAYLSRTPSAVRAVDILDQRGGRVHNDHIALRSFVDSSGRSGLAFLDFAFTSFGYKPEDDITIPNLPVNARWYEPPASTGWPKIFVSELRSAELPPVAAEIVFKHVDGYFASGPKSSGPGTSALRLAIAAGDGDALATLLDDPPWQPSLAEVNAVRSADGGDPALRNATEYAAWTLTHGHRINHLTILQNVLGLEDSGAKDLVSLNALLKSEGFEFNAAGGADGLTQGSEAAHLEQSSTVADLVPHTFGCGATKDVPLAFLELIRRHEGFRGFLGQNAKGIFASTHAR